MILLVHNDDLMLITMMRFVLEMIADDVDAVKVTTESVWVYGCFPGEVVIKRNYKPTKRYLGRKSMGEVKSTAMEVESFVLIISFVI